MTGATLTLLTMLMLAGPIQVSGAEPAESPESSLEAAETAFARTMAERNLEAFADFLDEEAIFSGPGSVFRGRDSIVEAWRPYFQSPQAPFSWRPERVHVLTDGSIGGTTGPVFDPQGNVVGQFVSTWRRDPSGAWKIILDMAPDCRAICGARAD